MNTRLTLLADNLEKTERVSRQELFEYYNTVYISLQHIFADKVETALKYILYQG